MSNKRKKLHGNHAKIDKKSKITGSNCTNISLLAGKTHCNSNVQENNIIEAKKSIDENKK